jgi:hypothetical protein
MDTHYSHLSRPGRQRWFVACLCLFFVGLSVQYTCKIGAAAHEGRSAFLRWRPQILDLDEGVNIYERHQYPNPPVMALLLAPLMKLPPLAGSLLWFYLKAGMALLAIHWALLLVEGNGPRFPTWARVVAVLLGLRPIMSDLTHGNVNLFILFLVVAALYAYGRRRDWSAGLLLALAIACKVTPALFVPYLAWKRAWRTLAACAVGLGLFLWLVPACFLGVRGNSEQLESWVRQMIVPYVVGGEVTSEHQNQSLPGVVYRLLTASASFSEYHGLEYVPAEFHNVVALSPAAAHGLLKGCMAAFAVLILWTCRTPPGERRGWRPAAEVSVILLGMLLFSERTWKHHYVTLILPLAVLTYYLGACPAGPRLRGYLIGTLTLVGLLMAATGTGVPGLSERAGKLAQVYGAYVWANLLLVAALTVLLKFGARTEAVRAEGPGVFHVRVTAPEMVRDPGRHSVPGRLPAERG